MIYDLWRNALLTIGLVAAPFLVVALVVGLITSLFQAATQLQENVISFVPKVVALGLVLALAGPWVVQKLGEHAAGAFASIVKIGTEAGK